MESMFIQVLFPYFNVSRPKLLQSIFDDIKDNGIQYIFSYCKEYPTCQVKLPDSGRYLCVEVK